MQVVEPLLLHWAEICGFYIICHHVKYMVMLMLGTNVMRLPRFVIVPCTCVSFVVSGVFVQMKISSTQKVSLYYGHHLVLEICDFFFFALQ